MYAQGIMGLKGNCVYWIGGSGRDQGMVFDMETGRSTTCLPTAGGAPQSTICWYFLCDMVNNCNNINGAKQVYQTREFRLIKKNNRSDVLPEPCWCILFLWYQGTSLI
jgi:hypothetical protein